ncbi:GntR family transcriptional regulator [Ohessyouella blattaphilus]|uniref:GntR family transcriptional regulator n=1 Tax=Ohessyouella blattaphilus TaxID=2949333 RepID=A0ABT1EI83_9FIRM|nr:GntR family transcriptional regulator [Ohessyouella blattaphilus]MCP1110410.1 GntR family transcriptional regulator [Ohessyouella blattaphilus]MCR8563804.1 GntR family transcriptional regulator [Ohessyouella blattaphilus]
MDYRVPPGVEAIEKLQNFIKVNRLTANTRIPSERDLCEMWGVRRSTLRQAVDTLVESGELYRVKGAGVYVAVSKLVRNMSGADAMIDELMQQGIPMSKKIISARVIEATKQISKRLRIPLGRKVYEYIRVREVGHIPSIMETSYIDCEQYPDFDKHYNNKTSMASLFRNLYHQEMVKGEERISITYASESEAGLLDIEANSSLFFTAGVLTNEENVPVMYYKQLLRSDRFKFVSMISK